MTRGTLSAAFVLVVGGFVLAGVTVRAELKAEEVKETPATPAAKERKWLAGEWKVKHVETAGASGPFDAWRASGHPWESRVRPIHELRVAVTATDHDAAVAFYRDVAGLPQIADWSSADGKVVVLDGGRATLELIDEAQARYIDTVEVGRRVAGQIRLALEVDDSAAVAERMRANGAVLLGSGPVDTPWGDRNVRMAAPADLQLTLFSKLT